MTARIRFIPAASAAFAALWAITACNGILGNHERDFDGGSDSGDAAANCALGTNYCAAINTCGSSTDPDFGCGNATCEPCAVKNGTAKCGGTGCVIASCNPGFDNCNSECIDISTITDCGGCGNGCPSGQFCSPTPNGGSPPFSCTATCPTGTSQCGSQCVNTNNIDNCGGCGKACESATNGTYACVQGVCTLTCADKFGLCDNGTLCVRQDINHCGSPVCGPCASTLDGTAQCIGSGSGGSGTTYACTITCEPGRTLCNAQCVDEQVDNANCGKCGVGCRDMNGGGNTTCACSGGKCVGLCDVTTTN